MSMLILHDYFALALILIPNQKVLNARKFNLCQIYYVYLLIDIKQLVLLQKVVQAAKLSGEESLATG